jgi:hypothetical protein
MFAAKSVVTFTTTFEGLLITGNPEESLIATLEKTVNGLVAGGLITFVILKENVPEDGASVPILKEISEEVNVGPL